MASLSRRDFARAAAALAAVAACPNLPAAAQYPGAPALPAGLEAEAQAQTTRILAIYGSRLDAAQKARIAELVRQHLAMMEVCRAFPMHNGDAPATVLGLVRGGRRAE